MISLTTRVIRPAELKSQHQMGMSRGIGNQFPKPCGRQHPLLWPSVCLWTQYTSISWWLPTRLLEENIEKDNTNVWRNSIRICVKGEKKIHTSVHSALWWDTVVQWKEKGCGVLWTSVHSGKKKRVRRERREGKEERRKGLIYLCSFSCAEARWGLAFLALEIFTCREWPAESCGKTELFSFCAIRRKEFDCGILGELGGTIAERVCLHGGKTIKKVSRADLYNC